MDSFDRFGQHRRDGKDFHVWQFGIVDRDAVRDHDTVNRGLAESLESGPSKNAMRGRDVNFFRAFLFHQIGRATN